MQSVFECDECKTVFSTVGSPPWDSNGPLITDVTLESILDILSKMNYKKPDQFFFKVNGDKTPPGTQTALQGYEDWRRFDTDKSHNYKYDPFLTQDRHKIRGIDAAGNPYFFDRSDIKEAHSSDFKEEKAFYFFNVQKEKGHAFAVRTDGHKKNVYECTLIHPCNNPDEYDSMSGPDMNGVQGQFIDSLNESTRQRCVNFDFSGDPVEMKLIFDWEKMHKNNFKSKYNIPPHFDLKLLLPDVRYEYENEISAVVIGIEQILTREFSTLVDKVVEYNNGLPLNAHLRRHTVIVIDTKNNRVLIWLNYTDVEATDVYLKFKTYPGKIAKDCFIYTVENTSVCVQDALLSGNYNALPYYINLEDLERDTAFQNIEDFKDLVLWLYGTVKSNTEQRDNIVVYTV